MRAIAILGAFSLAAISAASAAPSQLISNGNFATGDLTGWSVNTTFGFANNFYVVPNGSPAPVSGWPIPPDPSGAAYFAVSDQNGVGGEELIQGFTVSNHTTLTLSFDWYNMSYYPQFGVAIDGSEQAARADVLLAGAPPFDVGASVVDNLILNGAAGAWTTETFDLSGLAPGSYELRFGNGQCCLFQEVGVTDVSLLETPAPEPSTWAMMIMGFAGLGIAGFGVRKSAPLSA